MRAKSSRSGPKTQDNAGDGTSTASVMTQAWCTKHAQRDRRRQPWPSIR